MEILIVGNEAQYQETRLKFGDVHTYKQVSDYLFAEPVLQTTQIVFDFFADAHNSRINLYKSHNSLAIFINTTLRSLAELGITAVDSNFFGFCGMSTFLNREVLEVSLLDLKNAPDLKKVCELLNTAYLIVNDKVGLVTPRVVSMIINEAYYTVEEGTASREDIDLAMKLGTNYPYGPFEWSERIGKRNLVAFLDAMYKSTNDSRYRICKLLERESIIEG